MKTKKNKNKKLFICFRISQPLCLGGIVSFFAQTDRITSNDAYWYALGIILSTAYKVLTYHSLLLYLFKMSGKIRVACSGLIYQKSLRILKSSIEDGQIGKVINLSNDLAKLDEALPYLNDILKGPLEAFAFLVVIYMEIGVAAFVGMSFLASFNPLKGNKINCFIEHCDDGKKTLINL